MRATRAKHRAERASASPRAENGSRGDDRRGGEAPAPVTAPEVDVNPTPAPGVREPADHADCDVTIGELRAQLVDLEERYDDLVLSRWMLSRKYEHALGRMRSHDPAGIVWLVEQLAGWERDNEARRIKRLQEPNRELVRRRYEEEFHRRLEHVRRRSQQ